MALGNTSKILGDIWEKNFSERKAELPYFEDGCKNVQSTGGVKQGDLTLGKFGPSGPRKR